MNSPFKKTYRWKNKIVSERVYLNRMKLQERMKNKWKQAKEEGNNEINENADSTPTPRLGRLIVDMDVMIAAMTCTRCNQSLALRNIIHQIPDGAAVELQIKCHHCSNVNAVPTSGHYIRENGEKIYIVNYQLAQGAIDAGLDYEQISKFLAIMDLPPIEQNTFERHVEIVKASKLENCAEQSCTLETGKEMADTV